MPTGDIWPQRPAKQESEVCGEGDPHGERAPGTRTTWAGHPATRQSPGSSCGIHTLHAEHALTGSRGNVSESLWESGPNDTHLHHQRDGASEAGGWEGSAPLSPSLSARAAVMEHCRLRSSSTTETPLTVLETGRPRSRCQQIPASQTAISLCPRTAEGRGGPVGSPRRALVPSTRPHPRPHLLPEVLPNTITQGIRCQPQDLGGH